MLGYVLDTTSHEQPAPATSTPKPLLRLRRDISLAEILEAAQLFFEIVPAIGGLSASCMGR